MVAAAWSSVWQSLRGKTFKRLFGATSSCGAPVNSQNALLKSALGTGTRLSPRMLAPAQEISDRIEQPLLSLASQQVSGLSVHSRPYTASAELRRGRCCACEPLQLGAKGTWAYKCL